MALDLRPTTFAWAVVDLAEIRATGERPWVRRARGAELRRLIALARPTTLVVTGRRSPCLVREARRARIPVIAPPRRAPSIAVIEALYPETRVFAPTPRLRALLRLAGAALLLSRFPSRHYAPRSH